MTRRDDFLRPIRTYAVAVSGFDGDAIYSARSPAKARARAYYDFLSCYQNTTFHDFLVRSSVRRVPDPPGVGQRILVGGKPATRCYSMSCGSNVPFMRDDGDVVLLSHPLDVEPMTAARPQDGAT